MTEAVISTTPLPDLFITEELDRRTPGTIDRDLERRATRDLIARMAEAPEQVLPRLVDLAMELTGGVSAGLSLYERDPQPGVFRWRHLQGVLAPFEDATTPREYSPCGVTLDRNQPVLSLHPERYYGWISDAAIVVPEVLLVPLRVQGGEALGTLWIVSDREGWFTRAHADLMSELAWYVGIAVRMVETQQRLERALEEQQTLTREMSHRLKNLFSVTDALIRISEKASSTPKELAETLSGRLHALASAHALVSRHLNDVGHAPRVSDMETVIRAILAPHVGQDAELRFILDGPPIRCGDHAINGLALILHELATNAAKYGALSTGSGRVAVTWREAGDDILLEWVERDGPVVSPPGKADGFGSLLMRRTVSSQFAGTLAHDWNPKGLAVSMTLKAGRIAA